MDNNKKRHQEFCKFLRLPYEMDDMLFPKSQIESYNYIDLIKNSMLFKELPENYDEICIFIPNDINKPLHLILLKYADKEALLKKGFLLHPSIVYHKDAFELLNENYFIEYPLSELNYNDFMGIPYSKDKPIILTPEATKSYIKNGWEDIMIKNFKKTFERLSSDSPSLYQIDYHRRSDVNLYANEDILLFTDKEQKNWIGGFIRGDRYIRPEYRGKGLGTEAIVARMLLPTLNPPNGTGFYSPDGYKSRVKAFEILTNLDNPQKLNTHDKKIKKIAYE